jgi:multiple sugar transport system substrate-binding protein
VQLPYTLRDPFVLRTTPAGVSVALAQCEGLLGRIEGRIGTGLLDLSCCRPTSMRKCCGNQSASCGRATTLRRSSTRPRSDWDAITDKIGVDKQKAVYQTWAAKSGAYPK